MLHTLFSLRAHAHFREQRLVWFSAEQPEQEIQEQHTEEQAEMEGESEWDVDMNASLSDAEGESEREAQQLQQANTELQGIQEQNQSSAQPQFHRISAPLNQPSNTAGTNQNVQSSDNETPEEIAAKKEEERVKMEKKAQEQVDLALQNLSDPTGPRKQFKDLAAEDRERIQNEVMRDTGATVADDGTVSVSKDRFETGFNKLAGKVAILAAPIMKMFGKFREMMDKISGTSKPEEKKAEVEKTPEEKNKERGLELMRTSGLTFNPPDAFNNPKAAEYVVQKSEGAENVPHFRFEKGKWEVIDDFRLKDGNWFTTMHYSEVSSDGSPLDSAIQWNALTAKLENSNAETTQESTKKAAGEKVKATVAGVTSDKWMPSKEAGDSYSYKKAKDGRVYRQNGTSIDVNIGDEWVNAAKDAGITDAKTQDIYNQVLMAGGDKGWVKIVSLVGYSYAIDLPNKTLVYSSTFGSQQDYQPGIQQWQSRANKFNPTA